MEYLALHDGMLQPVTTVGGSLLTHGAPFRERPEARDRSGVPLGVVTTERVPSGCRCSWSYTMGKLTLKYSSTACPLLRDHQRSAVAGRGYRGKDGEPEPLQ
jgi:hypothetical protein